MSDDHQQGVGREGEGGTNQKKKKRKKKRKLPVRKLKSSRKGVVLRGRGWGGYNWRRKGVGREGSSKSARWNVGRSSCLMLFDLGSHLFLYPLSTWRQKAEPPHPNSPSLKTLSMIRQNLKKLVGYERGKRLKCNQKIHTQVFFGRL